MKHKGKTLTVVAAVALGCLTASTNTLATPPSNPAPIRTNAFTGTIDGRTHIKQDKVSLTTKSSTDVAVFTLTYPPHSYSGWHSHPGIVVAVVESGSVDRQVGCKIQHFSAGQAFTEVGTHRVSNPGTVDAVLQITQIYPASATATRFDQSDPCPAHPTP